MDDWSSRQAVGEVLCVLEGIFQRGAVDLDAHPQVDVVKQRAVGLHVEEDVHVLGPILDFLDGFQLGEEDSLRCEFNMGINVRMDLQR